MSDDNGGQDAAPANLEHLNIKVTDNNNEVFFKIKRTTKLDKLMTAFCERQGKSMSSVRFLFDGSRVQPTDTPDAVRFCLHLPAANLAPSSLLLSHQLTSNPSSKWPTATPSKSTRNRSAAQPNLRIQKRNGAKRLLRKNQDRSAQRSECGFF